MFLLGLLQDVYPLSMGGALSIIESLVWRAGAFHKQFKGSLQAESKQVLFKHLEEINYSFIVLHVNDLSSMK